ncbi:MAG: hypothetical protein L7T85_03325 [Flavobacteriaceae bacterium]|nr:hypothetical protein [Flavobacteriaceae bacterium]
MIKNSIPHVLSVALFALLSLAYFYPLLSGKVIVQSDIQQFQGMQRQVVDHRADYDEEPYWADNAFGGMPTYQITSTYPSDFIGKVDKLIRFLPRPADYLFVYLLSFYLLMLFFTPKVQIAIAGAIAFGFSTYLLIILGVGHNTKALAIGYMPLVVLGVIQLFSDKRKRGFVLLALAMGLQLHANHYQMTYYALIHVGLITLGFVIDFVRKKQYQPLVKSLLTMIVAMLLALSFNATQLLATSEYAKESTRGNSPLKESISGEPVASNDGLSYDYITEYSYGIIESLNLIIPRLTGGGSGDRPDSSGELAQFLQTIDNETAQYVFSYARTYWGDQPIVEAPAYIGITVFFIAMIGFFLMRRRWRFILLSSILVSLLISWGKHLPQFTQFLIDYVPFYNKFRAVSSAQVILELCFPIAAALGLIGMMDSSNQSRKDAINRSALIVLGILGLVWIAAMTAFDYQSAFEPFAAYPEILNPLMEDRKSILLNDLMRSLGFVVALYIICRFALIENRKRYVIPVVALVILIDLWSFSRNYVNSEDFANKSVMQRPFQATAADRVILKDSTRYRVFEPRLGMAHARTAYFHNTIGGYHGAKPHRMQALYDYHLSETITPNVVNMLNIKYTLQTTEDGSLSAGINPNAYGNAWLVEEVISCRSADHEIRRLATENLAKTALTTESFSQREFVLDSLSSISLVAYKANELRYKASVSSAAFAVFSEMHYPHGWQAYIDEVEVPHYRVNYALRGLIIPSGQHDVVFRFEPDVIARGTRIQLAGYGIFALLILLSFAPIGLKRSKP